MAIHITRLNGGDITIGSGGGSTPTGYTLTLSTISGANVNEYPWGLTVMQNGVERTYTDSDGVTSIPNVTQITNWSNTEQGTISNDGFFAGFYINDQENHYYVGEIWNPVTITENVNVVWCDE